jgi:hypothetical protein
MTDPRAFLATLDAAIDFAAYHGAADRDGIHEHVRALRRLGNGLIPEHILREIVLTLFGFLPWDSGVPANTAELRSAWFKAWFRDMILEPAG